MKIDNLPADASSLDEEQQLTAIGEKLQSLAEEGNILAVQELYKIREQRNFEKLIEQLDDDELD